MQATVHQTTLVLERLINHFRATSTDPIVGLHTTQRKLTGDTAQRWSSAANRKATILTALQKILGLTVYRNKVSKVPYWPEKVTSQGRVFVCEKRQSEEFWRVKCDQ